MREEKHPVEGVPSPGSAGAMPPETGAEGAAAVSRPIPPRLNVRADTSAIPRQYIETAASRAIGGAPVIPQLPPQGHTPPAQAGSGAQNTAPLPHGFAPQPLPQVPGERPPQRAESPRARQNADAARPGQQPGTHAQTPQFVYDVTPAAASAQPKDATGGRRSKKTKSKNVVGKDAPNLYMPENPYKQRRANKALVILASVLFMLAIGFGLYFAAPGLQERLATLRNPAGGDSVAAVANPGGTDVGSAVETLPPTGDAPSTGDGDDSNPIAINAGALNGDPGGIIHENTDMDGMGGTGDPSDPNDPGGPEATLLPILPVLPTTSPGNDNGIADALDPVGTPQDPTVTPVPGTENDRICYLTFDDGPSKLTPQFLDILAKEDVKATFFVLGQNVDKNPEYTRAIYNAGHLLANHSYTHDRKAMYSSSSALLKEIQRTEDKIAEVIGPGYQSSHVFRFPGGATDIARPYRRTVSDAGYRWFDWNVLNGDAQLKGEKTADRLYNFMVETYNNASKKEIVVLMHDTGAKQTTVDMLERAIQFFKAEGYRFDTMDHKSFTPKD